MTSITVTPDTQISTVVARYPITLRILEAMGIDYCCGGKRTLTEAATEVGMPVPTVIAILQTTIDQADHSPSGERDWQKAPLDELMAHIVETHHTFMRHELPRIDAMMTLVGRVHGPHHADILVPLAERFSTLKLEIEAHLAKEEAVNFPSITRLLSGQRDDITLPGIAELEEEHEAAGAILAAMREITHNYLAPEDACATYRGLYEGLQAIEADLHQHIHLENNILFPRAYALAKQLERAA